MKRSKRERYIQLLCEAEKEWLEVLRGQGVNTSDFPIVMATIPGQCKPTPHVCCPNIYKNQFQKWMRETFLPREWNRIKDVMPDGPNP